MPRVFATVTGPNAGPIQDYAQEYTKFGWNMNANEVREFLAEHGEESVYSIILRVPQS